MTSVNIQEKIIIKVPPEVAQAYRSATEAEQDAVNQLRKTMDAISQSAQAKGLTPEIFESILNENE